MNGEDLSIPTTTLAGIASLTDLLPEMPLPCPLPQAYGSRSLLFHPRVTEESTRLLKTSGDAQLIDQLMCCLRQSSADHIELKEPQTAAEPPSESCPELLRSALQRGVFRPAPLSLRDVRGPSASGSRTPLFAETRAESNVPNCVQNSSNDVPVLNATDPTQLIHDSVKNDRVPGFVNSVHDNGHVVDRNFEPAPSAPCVQIAESGDQPTAYPSPVVPKLVPSAPVLEPSGRPDADPDPLTAEKKLNLIPNSVGPGENGMPNARCPGEFTGDEKPALENKIDDPGGGSSLKPVVVLNRASTNGPSVPKSNALGDYKLACNPVVKLDRLDPTRTSFKIDDANENHRVRRNASSSSKFVGDKSGSESEEEGSPKHKIFRAKGKEREESKKKERDTLKRKREEDSGAEEEERSVRRRLEVPPEPPPIVPKKPKVRRVELKLIPVLDRLNIEEFAENNTYQRFSKLMDQAFEAVDDMDLNPDHGDNNAEENEEDEDNVPQELLLSDYILNQLREESGRLKDRNAMELVPTDRLVRLIHLMLKNIKPAVTLNPLVDPDEDEEQGRLWMGIAMERIMRAVNASLIVLNIITSKNMPKRVYMDDVIDKIVTLTKYQLQSTIFPSYDPVYRAVPKKKDGFSQSGSMKKKRAHAREVKEKSITQLYRRLCDAVTSLSELLGMQSFTDTVILKLSSLGVGPFFVENVSELQLSCLKLVTVIFSRYEQHRRLLLDDILASIARLPTSKRGLRTYRLRNSEETIQMVTALVLQLIQCVIKFPANLQFASSGDHQVIQVNADGSEIKVDIDVFIVQRYEKARSTAANFLSHFLAKTSSKGEEVDYRPLFENFVQDLLATVNKPDWPAAELLLSLLGFILVNNFSKGKDMSVRVSSLEYLGVIAARLRKDAVTSRLGVDVIDKLIAQVKEEEEEQSKETGAPVEMPKLGDPEEDRTQYLQRLLLEYLGIHSEAEPALKYTKDFYIAQWYVDAAKDIRNQQQSAKNAQNGDEVTPQRRKEHKKKKKSKRRKDDTDDEDETDEEEDGDQDNDRMKKELKGLSDSDKREVYRLTELRKKFLLRKIMKHDAARNKRGSLFQTELDADSAELIARYLASKRDFLRSFNSYLRQILSVLAETAIAVRTKAMKCLAMIVEADPSVLERKDVLMGVNHSFLDLSTSVREAAVDLVGRFIMSRPNLVNQYYDMLSKRILDTGVSVRKRVIKILKDVCTEYPDFPKIPEICVKMIRRVNDEEGIRKLVMEVFQGMWFTPIKERPGSSSRLLVQKVMNIVDVVATCSKANNLEWFEQLLRHMFKPKEDKEDSTKINTEPPKVTLQACQQIVDCLVENVLLLEEGKNAETDQLNHVPAAGTAGKGQTGVRRHRRLAGCMQTLHLFAKIHPILLINHGMTLQPYLTCSLNEDAEGQQIVRCTANILEVIVPLIEHPSEPFLAQLEEDVVKLIMRQPKTVVVSAVQCLASIVNRVTRNYSLVKDCLGQYLKFMERYQNLHVSNPTDPRLVGGNPPFRRSLFVVGLFMQFFDFRDQTVRCGLEDSVISRTFDIIYYFITTSSDASLRFDSLQAMGSMCIRHYEFMLKENVISLYSTYLGEPDTPVMMKVQVLNNLENYLKEEETRMIKQDQEWAKMGKTENLKEMRDVSSGMASTIMQVYLKPLLQSFLHPDMKVRHASLQVVQTIVNQGLVTPAFITHYLIAMSTDSEEPVYHTADKLLQELEKKCPSFIQMKVMSGVKLSYELQTKIQKERPIRGFRKSQDGTQNVALAGFVYSLLRGTKTQRRAIASTYLKQFDEKERSSLASMLYLADNIAYMPFQVLDEPLFIIHQIDVLISLHGGALLQSFKDSFMPRNKLQPDGVLIGPDGRVINTAVFDDDDDDDEDVEALLARVPEDTAALEDAVTVSQGVVLLLVLKQHLKDTYGLTDKRICEYNPNASGKIYEKAVNRRNVAPFNPKTIVVKLKELEKLELENREGASVKHDRTDLIRQYLDFKQLMLKIDPDQDEEDEEGNPISTPAKAINSSNVPQDGQAMRNLFATPAHGVPGDASHQTPQSSGNFAMPPAPHIIRPGHKTPMNSMNSMQPPMMPMMMHKMDGTGLSGIPPLKIHPPGKNESSPAKSSSRSDSSVPKLTINIGSRTPSSNSHSSSSRKKHSSHRKHSDKKKKKKKRHKYSESDTEESDSSVSGIID